MQLILGLLVNLRSYRSLYSRIGATAALLPMPRSSRSVV